MKRNQSVGYRCMILAFGMTAICILAGRAWSQSLVFSSVIGLFEQCCGLVILKSSVKLNRCQTSPLCFLSVEESTLKAITTPEETSKLANELSSSSVVRLNQTRILIYNSAM